MNDFLLVHGGAHGAWCWEAVLQALERRGCKGYALDLPGGGDDATPRADVTLRACLSAVDAFIASEDLDDFVLVGHSLAGILLPGIVAAHRDRIREVVLIAAIVLDEGERAIDVVDPERVAEYKRLAQDDPDYALKLSYDVARRRFLSDLGDAEACAAYEKLTPQPFNPYLEAAQYSACAMGSISRYIICRKDQNLPYGLCRRFAEKLGGTIEEIDAGHDVMLSKPEQLVELLLRGRQTPVWTR